MSDYRNFEAALSLERFSRYLGWSGGDRDRAIALYTLNTQLSEALYLPLQGFEIALRNRVHAVMSDLNGDRWFELDRALLGPYQKDRVADALAELAEAGKRPTPGRVVAALSFGFWTAMLGSVYEDAWRHGLNAIAATTDGRRLARKKLSAPLTPIRLLRNRIAHHEPILHWNLLKHRRNIGEVTQWLSPAVAEWVDANDRFAAVFGSGYELVQPA